MNLSAKELATAVADAIKPALKRRDDRIAELECHLAELEKAITRDNASEWPLRERNAA